MAELDLDGFLGHKTGAGGGNLLGKWKDRDGHIVDTWLHRKSPIVVMWRHGFFKLVQREDKQTRRQKVEVWGDNLVCHEAEDVLRMQNKRDDDGRRKVPPQRCPFCKLIEWVRME